MAETSPPAFRSLLGPQIAVTAEVLRRSAAMRMRREHDVSLAQLRTLLLIDHLEPVRLRDVAAGADADKAQISRVVSSLVARSLVSRRALPTDARSAHLVLTASGRDKVRGIVRSMRERDEQLRAPFHPDEIERFLAVLARIRHGAERLVEDEERLAALAPHTPS